MMTPGLVIIGNDFSLFFLQSRKISQPLPLLFKILKNVMEIGFAWKYIMATFFQNIKTITKSAKFPSTELSFVLLNAIICVINYCGITNKTTLSKQCSIGLIKKDRTF